MARKKKHEEHENHERWLVSYADFITLLFAFFVVMYSMSSVNEGKYRVLSESMEAAFRPITRSMAPVQLGDPVRSLAIRQFPVVMDRPVPASIIPLIPGRFTENVQVEPAVASGTAEERPEPIDGAPAEEQEPQDESSAVSSQLSPQMQYMGSEIEEYFEELIEEEQIELRRNPLWLEIEIKSNILFPSGSADLAENAESIMAGMGQLLARYPNPLTVEGFTDNLPIQNSIFPSNWELSSARAASVVRLFEQQGVEPIRMSSVGYGEFRPRDENDTPQGRASNRRVVVVIMAEPGAGVSADSPFSDLEKVRQRNTYMRETQGWW
ncbi:MAG: flagellar motor protein MotD [Gammaproteobacteria bacterium]